MGNEATCEATIDGRRDRGRALLETNELIFRGSGRLVIPFATIAKVRADGGDLHVEHAAGKAAFGLGEKTAAAWAKKIASPKSVLDKLGVKVGQKVAVVDVADASFVADLEARVGALASGRAKDLDVLFLGVAARTKLAAVGKAVTRLKRDGALWLVRPKGSKAITEAETMAAGKAAGLVDVKVVAFSATHTAEKFVIPVAKR